MNDSIDPTLAGWLRRKTPREIDDAVVQRIDAAIRSVHQRRRGTALLRAVGGATVVTALVALVGVAVVTWAPWTEPSRQPGGPSAPSASPSAAPSPTPGTSGASADWTILSIPDPRPEEGQGENIHDVVAGGPGYVAVGRSVACCDDGLYDDTRQTAGIWTSEDGVTWDAVEDVSALGPAEVHAVAAGPDGRLLAVGLDMRGLGPDEEPPTGVGMWRSADGIHWEPAPGPDGHFSFRDVVSTADGWLVVGNGRDGVPRVFTSTDLESWSVEALPEEGSAHGLARDADGRVLVIGSEPESSDSWQPEPRGWIGTPGDWHMVDLPANGPAAAIGNRFTIVDRYGLGAVSWSSTDGRTWESGEPWPAGEGGGDDITDIVSTIETVIATSKGLVAGGTLQVADEEWVPAIWRSPDGRLWLPAERLPLAEPPQETAVHAIVETPAGIVALGYAYYELSEAAGWVGN